MSLEALKVNLPETAKDIRLNLSTVLSDEGTPELSAKQRYGIALASAYAARQDDVIQAILSTSSEYLAANEIAAAKSAATIMAMNNIYYRFVHLINDKAYGSMPAKLRMNVIANPGIDKLDFELNSLAVSAINGCGMCMDAHAHALEKAGASKLAIQSAVRIAAVINATAMAIQIA